MKKKAKKAVSKSMLRRYLAGLLTVITFLTAIPLSNLAIAKAVDEKNYSHTININLDGGSSSDIFYMSNVDRTGCGYTQGQWVDWLGIGKTFLDRTLAEHTVENRNADNPCEGTFTIRADAVGITPHVVIITPTRDGYTFTGWSTNTGTADYDGNTAFEIGAYAPDNITITATWSRDSYALDTDWDEGINYIYQEGGISYEGKVGYYTPGSTATTKINMKPGYEFAYYTEDDEYYSNHVWTDADANGTDTWNMFGNRHVTAHTRRIQYGLDVNEYVWNPNTNKYEEHDSNFTYARVGLKINGNTIFSNATDAWSSVYYGEIYYTGEGVAITLSYWWQLNTAASMC